MSENRSKKGSSLSIGCLTFFGLLFFIAGLFLSNRYFNGYSTWWQSRSWEEVPCWIESTQLEKSNGSDTETYKAVATYRYEYNGRIYHGNRVCFSNSSDNIGNFHEAAHKELSKYIDNPKKHSIQRSFRC